MRVVIYDDEGLVLSEQDFECEAVVVGATTRDEHGFESRCFCAGQGDSILRSINAVCMGLSEKPGLIAAFVGAKMAGDLDAKKTRERGGIIGEEDAP